MIWWYWWSLVFLRRGAARDWCCCFCYERSLDRSWHLLGLSPLYIWYQGCLLTHRVSSISLRGLGQFASAASCLNNFVLCFCIPKCASNGMIFVVAFGMMLIFWITFANLLHKVAFERLQSLSSNDSLRLIVCIRGSTIPVALWSAAVANISLVVLFLQNISFFLP